MAVITKIEMFVVEPDVEYSKINLDEMTEIISSHFDTVRPRIRRVDEKNFKWDDDSLFNKITSDYYDYDEEFDTLENK